MSSLKSASLKSARLKFGAFLAPHQNRAVFERAGQAVMAKIMENEKAAAALPLTGPGRVAIPTINAPDLQKEAAKQQKG